MTKIDVHFDKSFLASLLEDYEGPKSMSDATQIMDALLTTSYGHAAPKPHPTTKNSELLDLHFAKPSKPDTISTYQDKPAMKGLPMDDFQIYRFGACTDGDASMKDKLGGKGANLAEMSKLGIPVPPGFTLPCDVSIQYLKDSLLSDSFMAEVKVMVLDGLAYLKSLFEYEPLLSVRSGARVSMPGMMDTILNVGLTTGTLPSWKKRIGERAALDSYRRLIQMYSSVALGIDMKHFDAQLSGAKDEAGAKLDSDLTAPQLTKLIVRYLDVLQSHGKVFPDTREEQVMGAVEAVFKSWDNPRAIEYRKINKIPDDWGTAVTIQSMVFGNMNDKSATGVLFSRDPSTGEDNIVGEYLVNAQGEDVVAGIRTPEPLNSLGKWNEEVNIQLCGTVAKLELHYRDMQDIEFTVQDGKLYILQTRNAKRSARAAFKVAYDMAMHNIITKDEAVKRVNADQLITLLKPQIDPSFKIPQVLTGIPAGGGIVSGVAVFSATDAINCSKPCILVTDETDPDDIGGMNASVGILTATGGLTSHAAVVARGMDKTCVVGCTDLQVNLMSGKANGFKAGDLITICGMTGRVWVGSVPVIEGGVSSDVKDLLSWMAEGDFAERLELSSNLGDIEKAVKESSSKVLYIDTCLMEGELLAGCLTSLGKELDALPSVQNIIVDLSTSSVHYEPEDSAFVKMFGSEAAMSVNTLYKIKAMEIALWPASVKDKCIIQLPEDTTVTVRATLTSAGCKVLGYVNTFADLLNFSGPVQIKPEVIEKVFGGKVAYEVALKLTGADKSKAKPMPPPAYWYQHIWNGV